MPVSVNGDCSDEHHLPRHVDGLGGSLPDGDGAARQRDVRVGDACEFWVDVEVIEVGAGMRPVKAEHPAVFAERHVADAEYRRLGQILAGKQLEARRQMLDGRQAGENAPLATLRVGRRRGALAARDRICNFRREMFLKMSSLISNASVEISN
jgi:hypothetical protein